MPHIGTLWFHSEIKGQPVRQVRRVSSEKPGHRVHSEISESSESSEILERLDHKVRREYKVKSGHRGRLDRKGRHDRRGRLDQPGQPGQRVTHEMSDLWDLKGRQGLKVQRVTLEIHDRQVLKE